MGLALYLLGVAFHSLRPWENIPLVAWAFLFVSALSALVFFPECSRFRVGCVGLLCFMFGVWRFDLTVPSSRDGLLAWTGEVVSIDGRIVSRAHFGTGHRLTVRADRLDTEPIFGPANRLNVSFFGRTPPRIGSRIRVRCLLRPIQELFFVRDGIWVGCQGSAAVDVYAPTHSWDVRAILPEWRAKLTNRIARLFPSDEATLLSGILYGEQQLSREQRDLMRRSGLMHLVAVSGSNVTIVVAVLLPFALAFGLRRRQAFWFVTLGLIVFVGFVGFSASVSRAAVMGWLVLFARHVGRMPKTSWLLLCSAAVLVTVNPWLLGFDAGFALSFLATWGLLAWVPLVAASVPWIPERFGLREAFATTTGATIMTLPYLAWAFGRMSLAGLFTNLLALPLVPFIMLWGAMSAAWGDAPGSVLVHVPTLGFLRLLERIAHFADQVPILDIRLTKMDFLTMLLLYGVLGLIWRQWKRKKELSTD